MIFPLASDPSMRRPVRKFQQLCAAVTVLKRKYDERGRISKLAKEEPKDYSLSAVVATLWFLVLRTSSEVSRSTLALVPSAFEDQSCEQQVRLTVFLLAHTYLVGVRSAVTIARGTR